MTTEKTFFWAALSSLLMLLYYLEHGSIPALLWQSTYEKTAFFWVLISFTLWSQLAFAASFLQIDRRCGGWYRTFTAAALATAVVCIVSTATPLQANHDLSQPLHSMRIFLDHLQPHVHGPEGARAFRRLQNSHRQMSESFKSIMELSKLESGGITPELRAVTLSDLLRRLHAEYRVLAAEKAIQLTLQPSSMIPVSRVRPLNRPFGWHSKP